MWNCEARHSNNSEGERPLQGGLNKKGKGLAEWLWGRGTNNRETLGRVSVLSLPLRRGGGGGEKISRKETGKQKKRRKL